MGSAPSGPSGPPFPNRSRQHADARTLWLQNSTNVFAQNVTCRGGEGVAFGSVGQYAGMVSERASPRVSRKGRSSLLRLAIVTTANLYFGPR